MVYRRDPRLRRKKDEQLNSNVCPDFINCLYPFLFHNIRFSPQVLSNSQTENQPPTLLKELKVRTDVDLADNSSSMFILLFNNFR